MCWCLQYIIRVGTAGKRVSDLVIVRIPAQDVGHRAPPLDTSFIIYTAHCYSMRYVVVGSDLAVTILDRL